LSFEQTLAPSDIQYLKSRERSPLIPIQLVFYRVFVGRVALVRSDVRLASSLDFKIPGGILNGLREIVEFITFHCVRICITIVILSMAKMTVFC